MTLHELNTLPREKLIAALHKCCASRAWVDKMLPFFPAEDLVELLEDAEAEWFHCSQEDWKEAFAQHPQIGDINSLQQQFSNTKEWASDEQAGVSTASQDTLVALAEGNRKYLEKFGYTFIAFATGKSAEELLEMLQERLNNDPVEEIEIAADEQNKITKLRLEKMLD